VGDTRIELAYQDFRSPCLSNRPIALYLRLSLAKAKNKPNNVPPTIDNKNISI